MAAFTSRAAGNWSLAGDGTGNGTWTQAGVPANGDTVTINHAVVVDVNTTVGTSPGDTTTVAILVNSGASLTIAVDVTLNCRGRFTTDRCTLTLGAGSEIILDSSASGGTYRYVLTGTTSGVTWNFIGTADNRCAVRGYDATNRGDVSFSVFNGTYAYDFRYCDFSYLGTSTASGINLYGGGASSMQYCVFDDCGRVVIDGYRSDSSVNVRYSTFNANNAYLRLAGAATTTATRRFYNNVVLCSSSLWSCANLVIQETVFDKAFSWLTTSNPGTGMQIQDCFFSGDDPGIFLNSIYRSYFFCTKSSNPHYFSIHAKYRNIEVSECLFETPISTSVGDFAVTGDSWASPYTLRLANNIDNPNPSGFSSGCVLNVLQKTNVIVAVEHNTYMGESGGVLVAETSGGTAGNVSALKSNLAWATGTGYVAERRESISTITQDIITPAEISHNWRWGLAAGSEGNGFDDDELGGPPTMFSVATSTFDQEFVGGDPQFVDSTRNLKKWALSKGEAETDAAAIALLKANTSLIIALVNWVRAGFRVQNASLNNAGHDGVTVGAMAYQAPLTAGSIGHTNIQDTTADLTSVADASGGASPITYKWALKAGSAPAFPTDEISGTAATNSVTGLTASTHYYVARRATDANATTADASDDFWTAPTLQAGFASCSTQATTTANMTCTAASGGTAPYTYQWYRGTSTGFTLNAGSLLTGKTDLSFVDTGLSPATDYYYVLVVTDSDASPDAANSNEVPVTTETAAVVGSGRKLFGALRGT